MSDAARLWMTLLGCCLFCLSLGGCGKAKQENVDPLPGASARTASAPKIYSMEDVDKELREGQLVMGSSRENTRAFFQSHADYQVCKDMDSFTVAVVRNSKVDKHADDIYIVARYNLDGTIGAMERRPAAILRERSDFLLQIGSARTLVRPTAYSGSPLAREPAVVRLVRS